MRTGPKPTNIQMGNLFPVTSFYAAYLLGFLWADGYLFTTRKGTVRVGSEAVTSDMEEIKPAFDYIGKWCSQSRRRNGRQPQTAFSCSSRPLYEWLVARDYLSKSVTSPYKILSDIPESLHHVWFRGFFDGDGNLYRLKTCTSAQVTLAGAIQQDWSRFEEILLGLGCSFTVSRIRKFGSTSSILRMTGKQNTLRFLDYIYSGEEFGLSRKREAYKAYKSDVGDHPEKYKRRRRKEVEQ